jgi:ATP-dependent protease ClpP protease subunit
MLKNRRAYFFILTPGGSVTCGIAVYDAMHYVEADVTTICVGRLPQWPPSFWPGAIGEDE